MGEKKISLTSYFEPGCKIDAVTMYAFKVIFQNIVVSHDANF